MGIPMKQFSTVQQQTAQANNEYALTAKDEGNNTKAAIDREGNVLGKNTIIFGTATLINGGGSIG